ncbi:hypothetical protein TVAG_098250 [Trichomonas vaginalis G3]|uniref:Uncharacterized protein n=2 Tax=Trichomonas vaginalis (strain ATCC PRA-98 / G3) TaxID=412133 RepID=A2ECA5_TRIV3|nr:hypothetical protein TVAG_098250 [Trichomonas vaginalis G3]|eukprot:XP_001321912.1 hypothetical protein [Trichomonas vaginalis G3]
MVRIAKRNPRIIYIKPPVDGNVSGLIKCIGYNGNIIHEENFDSFPGHPLQTAIPNGISFHEAVLKVLRLQWTGSSSHVEPARNNASSKDSKSKHSSLAQIPKSSNESHTNDDSLQYEDSEMSDNSYLYNTDVF